MSLHVTTDDNAYEEMIQYVDFSLASTPVPQLSTAKEKRPMPSETFVESEYTPSAPRVVYNSACSVHPLVVVTPATPSPILQPPTPTPFNSRPYTARHLNGSSERYVWSLSAKGRSQTPTPPGNHNTREATASVSAPNNQHIALPQLPSLTRSVTPSSSDCIPATHLHFLNNRKDNYDELLQGLEKANRRLLKQNRRLERRVTRLKAVVKALCASPPSSDSGSSTPEASQSATVPRN